MGKNSVIIGIGSNIDPYINFADAISRLKKICEVCALSPVQITKPIGILNQPDFINGVVMIKTTMNQQELGRTLTKIEDDMGRDRTELKFGPRNIDLDVVVWNGTVVDNDYYEREFLREAVDSITQI